MFGNGWENFAWSKETIPTKDVSLTGWHGDALGDGPREWRQHKGQKRRRHHGAQVSSLERTMWPHVAPDSPGQKVSFTRLSFTRTSAMVAIMFVTG